MAAPCGLKLFLKCKSDPLRPQLLDLCLLFMMKALLQLLVKTTN